MFETMPPAEAFPLARVAADRARALDEALPEAHAALGAIHLFHDWDLAAARASLEQAVGLNPNNVTAYTWLTIYHAVRGDPDTALDWARRAIQLDPLAAPASYSELFALYTAQRYQEAVDCANRVLTLNPTYAEGYRTLGWCLLALGRHAEAFDALRQAVKLGTSYAWALASLAAAHAQIGDHEEAERILHELEQQDEREWISPLTLGVVYAALGRYDDAVTCVERSFESRDCWVVSLAVEPTWIPLRGHPRFEAVIARLGLVPEPALALGSA
jgi:tetratricopeptide (TPR) repeat protein